VTVTDDLYATREWCMACLGAVIGEAIGRGSSVAAISWIDGPGGMRPTVAEGSDVLVRVHFGPPDRPMIDVVPVCDLERYYRAGLPVAGISAPGTPKPAIWAAFGVVVVPDGLVGLWAFDWAGCAGLLASGHPSAPAVRDHLLDRAHHRDRQRAALLAKEVGSRTFADSFVTAATEYLQEDPFQRSVERLPLTAWMVDLFLDQQLTRLGNQRVAQPITRTATAAVSAVAVDTWGATRPQAQKSNRRHDFLHEMPQTEWTDTAGDLASDLADNGVGLDRALAVMGEAEGVVDGWRRSGLTDREVVVMAMSELGFEMTEIGERIRRHRTTAARALAAAEKKLAAARTR
jgi:hypothetical protein